MLTEQETLKVDGTFASSLTERLAYRESEARSVIRKSRSDIL
ncbi:hypothetical protein [Shewanella cutis]|nr:hypothetical protein [Shewanella sp. PS-2]